MLNTTSVSERTKKDISPLDIYDKNKAWGLYSSLDIHDCHPEYIRDREVIRQYVLQLSEILRMECCGAIQIMNIGSEDSNEGCSMTQFIDSSLVTGHFEFKSNTAFIDIFSSKCYDPEIFSHFTLSYFRGSSYKLNVTVRK